MTITCAIPFVAVTVVGQEARVFDRQLASRVLGDERTITISVPANYDIARRRYPVLYVLDGEERALFDLAIAATRFDYQLDAIDHAIPPHIVVGIHQKNRGVEFGRSSAAFFRFVNEEVVPLVDRQFRTSHTRILMGHSLAGEFAIAALCGAGRTFSSVIAISPAISDSAELKNVTNCLTERARADSGRLTQLFISSGNRARDGTEAQFRPQHLALRKWLDDHQMASLRWDFVDLPDVSHSQTPLTSIPKGVWFVNHRSVWEIPSSTIDSIFAGTLGADAAVNAFYSKLADRMGYTVTVESKWLRIVAFLQGSQQKWPAAISTARRAVELYPEDIEAHLTLADVLARSGDKSGGRRALKAGAEIAERLAGTGQERSERLMRVQRAEQALAK